MSAITSPGNLQVQVTNKQIFSIALPIAMAMIVPQLNYLINNIFLGHYNEQALATAGITGVYYLIFAAIGFGLNNGLQALIARRSGENRPQEIGKIFNQGVLMSLLIAAIGIFLTWFVAPAILKLTISNYETYSMTVSFLKIRIWGLPFLYIYLLRNALLVGINQSKFLVIGTLAETIANIFFDYTLIFGKLGFPSLGFNGAAYASIIAEFTGMFVIFLVIHYKGIGRQFALFKNMKLSMPLQSLIFSMSGPLIFQHAISIISWQFFYLMIEHHGTQALAISNSMRNIFGFFGVFSWSFAQTTNTMVSNIIGQGKQHQVLPLINKIMLISGSISLIICALLNVFPETFLSVFGQPKNFVQHAMPTLRVVSLAMILLSVSTIWLNAVTGSGNSRITFLIELITIILYCAYVYITLEKLFLPIYVGWMSEWLYWTVLFSLSFWYIKSGRWQGKII
jgi:multidrug resistance protein, MATE family